jgi:hypothetical protein
MSDVEELTPVHSVATEAGAETRVGIPMGVTASTRAGPANGEHPHGRLLGAALQAFGALLWAYVVFGELVVGLEFPELLATLLVAAAFGLTWWIAVSRIASPWHFRKLAPGALGFVAWSVVLASTVALLGSDNPRLADAVSAMLWLVAALALFIGGVLNPRAARSPSRLPRLLGIALLVAACLATAIALLSALRRF